MRWRFEHSLDAPMDALLDAALDAETLRDVPRYMPLIASAARVSHETLDDGRVRVVDRYEPAFDPPRFARGITREMLGWDLTLTWNLATHAADFAIDPHIPAEWKRYADVRGAYRIEERASRRFRVMEGVIDLRIPMLGGLAERYALRELEAQFEGEARLLDARARARSTS